MSFKGGSSRGINKKRERLSLRKRVQFLARSYFAMSLSELFPEAANRPDILERLKYLSISFSQSSDDFFAKWESFALRQSSDTKVSDSSSLDAFQEYLEKGARSVSQAKKPRLVPRQLRGSHLTSNLRTENKSEPFTNAVNYTTRSLFKLNEPILFENESKYSVIPNFNLNTDTTPFIRERPFNTVPRDVNSELDAQIERMADCVASAYKLSKSDFVNTSQTTQNVCYAVGRVVRDPPQLKSIEEAEEYYRVNKKLDSRSMLLECSRRTGCGSRTSLDLSLIDDARINLFEGQIIAVSGNNPKGEQFIVRRILELPKLPVAQVPSAKRSDGPVRIAIGAAPSTIRMLEAFTTWAYRISRQSVSAVILIGPLLAEDESFDETSYFENKKLIREHLSRLSRTIQTPFVIVPSPGDAFTTDPLFPQPPLPDSELFVETPLIKASNPCTFSIDEVAIAVAANSFIRDMDAKNTSQVFGQLLRQRQFYPIYPPPLDMSIDVHGLSLTKIGPVAPNVLILPSSDEMTECGTIDDVLYIAAGKLSKGFALITVGGGKKPLIQRMGVEIMKFG